MLARTCPLARAPAAHRAHSRRAAVSVHASGLKYRLYDVPVSNNGARVRYTIYKKGLESRVDIVSPQTLGGLKSQAYTALNPQGKMPLLVLTDGTAIPESEVIQQYLLDKYADKGPRLVASTPEGRALANLATRIHDTYIVPVQGAMYRKMDSAEERAAQIAQIAFQLDVLEGLVAGPFFAGEEVTGADAAIFPTMYFMQYMLPTYFGWKGLFASRPKLGGWWEEINTDKEAKRVIKEIEGGLKGWVEADRWKVQGILDHVADKQYKWVY